MTSECALTLAHERGLEPHPEGGWYRRTWTAPTRVDMPRGDRATASAIIFLLDRDQEAAWHKVISDELWLWHGPGTLEIHLGGTGQAPDGRAAVTVLGAHRDCGEPTGSTGDSADGSTGVGAQFQLLVPAGTWQRTFARGDVAFATCVVSPEFTFDDWELANPTM